MSTCMGIIAEAGVTTDVTEIIFCYLVVSMSTIPVANVTDAEDSHVHTYLDSILKAFLCTDEELVSSWANKQDALGLKPDFSVSSLPWNTSFTLLTCELKPKHTASVLKDGYLSDLVKLGKQMKQHLEQMVNAGVASPMSFGILGDGTKLSLMIMDIDNEAVYRLYEFTSFEIITSLPDFIRLPAIIESFMAFKLLMNDVAASIEKVELSKKQGRTIRRSASISNLKQGSFSCKRLKKNNQ